MEPPTPPAVLFHGTAVKNLASIREQGLLPGKRQHVHLSRDHDTAVSVGQRHGRPVVLTVDAGRMSAAGILFFQADNGVWLTDTVPREYLGEEPTNSDGEQ
ncbi:RNA 2'-phosphotransferase [Rhizobium ruizarguesonis]|uniref:RNA 2'-phosphotransferase n=1 Tax=Rhizobium ruizarguesonis TaxID=2081791 RepID=UPI0037CA6224